MIVLLSFILFDMNKINYIINKIEDVGNMYYESWHRIMSVMRFFLLPPLPDPAVQSGALARHR